MDVDHIVDAIRGFSIKGSIDNTLNLIGRRVYTFSGKSDERVIPGVVHKTAEVFEKLGAVVKTDFDFDSAHVLPTLNYGCDCLAMFLPGLGRCNKYLTFEALDFIIGPLEYPT